MTVLTALHKKHLFIYNFWSIIVYLKQIQQIKKAIVIELYTGHEKELKKTFTNRGRDGLKIWLINIMKYYIVIIKYNYKENWKNAKNNSESRAQNGLYIMTAASVYKTA